MRKKKIIYIVIGAVLAIWLGLGIIDFSRVHSFKKPVFCISTELYKDGGSGHYVGLGYSFDIRGNFMPEVERKGVTEYSYYIFGVKVQSALRD